jgi:hypothetical protein
MYSSKFFHPESNETTVETIVVVPVFDDIEKDAAIVGHYLVVVPWYVYFQDILPIGTAPVSIVVESTCGYVFSFEIEGHNASLTSFDEALYDSRYKNIFGRAPLTVASSAYATCDYMLKVYPSHTYVNQYRTKNPLRYVIVVLAIFFATFLAFLIFDWLVSRRQSSLMTTARKQNALVSSLFPVSDGVKLSQHIDFLFLIMLRLSHILLKKSIQNKLFEDMEVEELEKKSVAKWNISGTAGLRIYLNKNNLDPTVTSNNPNGLDFRHSSSKPIADLFPETTVMFADIAGFTAWSSTREPSQVFTLLESVYAEFDAVAKRRRVFKVEVVGDCYVAVAGLPDPRPDHAVVMVKFSNDCLKKMHEVTRQLEVELGPDTTELGLRIGLHSGPVVAGVLRGDKSRFQLFGDTVSISHVSYFVEVNLCFLNILKLFPADEYSIQDGV